MFTDIRRIFTYRHDKGLHLGRPIRYALRTWLWSISLGCTLSAHDHWLRLSWSFFLDMSLASASCDCRPATRRTRLDREALMRGNSRDTTALISPPIHHLTSRDVTAADFKHERPARWTCRCAGRTTATIGFFVRCRKTTRHTYHRRRRCHQVRRTIPVRSDGWTLSSRGHRSAFEYLYDYDVFTANKCIRAFSNGPMTVMSRDVEVLPAENNQNNTDIIFINNARAPCKQYTTPAIAVHLLRFRTLLSRGSQWDDEDDVPSNGGGNRQSQCCHTTDVTECRGNDNALMAATSIGLRNLSLPSHQNCLLVYNYVLE